MDRYIITPDNMKYVFRQYEKLHIDQKICLTFGDGQFSDQCYVGVCDCIDCQRTLNYVIVEMTDDTYWVEKI